MRDANVVSIGKVKTDKRFAGVEVRSDKIILSILGIALIMRLATWIMLPESSLGLRGDEISYYRSGLQLLLFSEQNLFWPPLTGWLVAGLGWLFQTESLAVFRFFWIAFDLVIIYLIWLFSIEVYEGEKNAGYHISPAFVYFVPLIYAFYLTAIGYAVHVTSEVPALLFILSGLILIWSPASNFWLRAFISGILFGLVVLTRVNLFPLIPAVVIILFLRWRQLNNVPKFAAAGVFIIAAIIPSAGWVVRNMAYTGKPFLTLNLVSNYSRGSSDNYFIDLNLAGPVPTEAQITQREYVESYHSELAEIVYRAEHALTREQRIQILAEELPFQQYSVEEFFNQNYPQDSLPTSLARQISRMAGRVARLISPQTNVFDLFPLDTPLRQPSKLFIFGLANIQWIIVLLFGLFGLFSPITLSNTTRFSLGLIVAGCAAASLFSVSEPRYSFPFFFVLASSAVAFIGMARDKYKTLFRQKRTLFTYIFVTVCVGWAWVAAAVWAFSPGLSSHW